MAIVVLSLGFWFSPLPAPLDHRLLDMQFRLWRQLAPVEVELDPVIVGIDEASLKVYREPLALWHPHLGDFLQAMAAAKPRTLALDVVMPDKSYAFLKAGYDQPLLKGLMAARSSTTLVLAHTIDEQGDGLRPVFAPVVSLLGEDAFGLALNPRDEDGLVRRFQPLIPLSDRQPPNLAARVAQGLGLPLQSGLIDYTAGAPFDYIPFHRVVEDFRAGALDRLRAQFQGRVVMLGAVRPFEDRHFLPVNLAAWEPDNRRLPGVLIHAQVLRSLAHNGVIQPVPVTVQMLLLLLASLLWWLRRPLPLGLPMLLGGLFLTAAVSTLLLGQGLFLPLSSLIMTAGLAWFARLLYESVLASRERQRLTKSFGSYVSPNVMDEILAGHIQPKIGGERRHVCVLFSDIRSFTSRSEHQPPEAIIELLNDYFNEMTAAVHEHGGTVDKFIGDGLMCFFGAPNTSAEPARDAFRAAQQMLQRLHELNGRLAAKGVEPVQIGIGLHIGDAVIGHVGSDQRHEYTAIGDTVNTASRLEGLTKGLGYALVVSQAVAQALGMPDDLVSLGDQAVKGRAAVAVYGWQASKVGP